MLPTSESYKAAIKAPSRTDRLTGSLSLAGGSVIELSDDIIVCDSVTLKEQIVSGDMIELGTFYTNELNITIYDDEKDLSHSYANARIVPYYGIKLPTGEWEDVPLGVFKVDNSYTTRKEQYYKLTAFDCSIDFDREISHHAARQTVKDHILSACDEVGVDIADTFDVSDLPNCNVLVSLTSTSIQTYRDLVEACTALMGVSAKINRYGKFDIVRIYDKTANDEYDFERIIDGDERFGTEYFDLRSLIKYVSTTINGKNIVYTSDKTLKDDFGRNAVVDIPENPLLKDEGKAEQIWKESIKNFSIALRKANFDFIGDPSLECFDTLGARGGQIDNGRTIAIFPTKLTWKYRGKHTINCAFAELTEEKSDGSSSSITLPTSVSVKSKTDKRIDGVTYNADKGQNGVYFATGNGEVRIGSMPNQIVKVLFGASMACIPLFAATIPFTVTSAGTVQFDVVFDTHVVNVYKQYCLAGMHFKTITIPLIGAGNGGHSVTVQISSEDAAGIVDGTNTYATVNGSGLEANSAWDGTIYVVENFALKYNNKKAYGTSITDKMSCVPQYGNNSAWEVGFDPIVNEGLGGWAIQDYKDTIVWSNNILRAEPNEEYNEVHLIFKSSVTSVDEELDLSVFQVWGIVSEQLSIIPMHKAYINPDDTSMVIIETDDYSTYIGTVYISYDDKNSTLTDKNGGHPIYSFVTSFDKGGMKEDEH